MRPSILSQSSHSIQESRRLFQRRVFGRNSVVKKITIALAAGILLSACTALGADIPFTKIVIDNNTISNPWAKAMADIDGDGYMDMIVAPSNGSVIWYHYPDWTEYTIGSGGTECGIAVADIDGDGDMDVVVGPVWYENPRPAGDPRTSPWIAHSLGQNNHNVVVDFLDGDDKRDIVMVSEAGTTVYIFKQNTPTSWTRRNINPGVGSNGLAVADIDRDGKNDIVVPGKWLRNPGDIINGTWQTYTFGTWNNMACIAVADLNGDHWPDIIMTVAEGSGPVVWFENPGNPTVNTNWVRYTIDSENLTQAHTLFAADFNLDGKIDMVVSEFGGAGRVIVYQNQGSGLSWVRQVVGTTSLHNMAIGDYDNDGDIDLFGAQAYNNPPAEVWRNDTRTGSAQPSRVLVFSKTAGFRHESIPDCIAAVESLGAMNNFLVDATEDASVFTASNLNQYSAVVFCLTTGDVLDNTQQAAFQSFIESGKGWVGLHSACDTEYDWAWYGKLVGAYFNSEYSGGDINLTTVNFNHPSTGTMPASWTNQNDSVYKYSNDPTDNGATILVTADLGDGQAHPYSWYHDYNGGRAWYTAGGGDSNGFHEALFLKHLEGGINYARGVSVTVTAPPTLTSIIVSPSSASVVVNGKQQFTATAKDQFGNALVPQPSFTWTVTGGGTISSSGLFTAGNTAGGLFTVTATSGSVSGTASVTVTAPLILTSIIVSPSPASVAANGTQQFMATAKDQFGGALVPQPSFTWTVSGGGTINSNGLFTAGSTAGGPFTVTAASGGVSGTASVTVTTVSSFTIGETNILSTNDNGNGNLLVAQQATLGQTGTILSMSFYVTTASGNLRLGIYDATGPGGGPGALKAQTAAFTPVSGWNTQNVVSQVSLPAGTYWLAYLPSSNSLVFKMASTGSAKFYSYAYGALPATFSTSPTSSTYHWSFYATLQTASPTLTSISVSPSSASVALSGTQQFTATAKDQIGNPLVPQPSFTWTVSGGGTINGSGLFTAGSAAGGPFTVKAASGSVSGTASVTVTTVTSFTIGETNILSTNDNGNGNLLVAQQASLGKTATILSMSFYVTTASGNLRLGIYDATGPNGGPGKLKAQTAGFTPKSGWNTQNVVSQVSLPAGIYWLAYLPSSNSLGFKVVGSGSAKWYSYSYQALPATFSTSPTSGTYHWSFYATLQ